MKKKIAVMLAAVMAAGMIFTGCGSKDDGKASSGSAKEDKKTEDMSLQNVKDKGELILGLDPAFPPMGFTDDDQKLVGFDLDAAEEVCKRLGVKLTPTPIDWDTKEQELETEAIDCIWNGFTTTKEREEQMTLSEPYMTNQQVVVVLKDSKLNTLADLKDKTVVIQASSSAEDAINNNQEFKDSLKDGEPISVKDNVQAMLELDQSGADAVVMDKVVAMYYMDKHKGEYRLMDETLADENYVIGFKKGNNALCEEVENQLKEMAADGTLKKIAEKWFGEDITTIK